MTGSPRPALQAARRAQGWSQSDAARELAALARALGGPIATPASLKSLLSRWENGHAAPEPHYRGLLADLYGRTAAELELAPAGPAPSGAVARLRARLAAAAAVDVRLLRTWADQLTVARRLDDEVGAAGAAGLVRALVDELDRALVHTVEPRRRAEIASVLAPAATLAGWQELDLGDPEQAWLRFDQARTAVAADSAVEAAGSEVVGSEAAGAEAAGSETAGSDAAGSDATGAEAAAGLAAVLVDLGDPEAAIALLGHVAAPASTGARAWLDAARGAALAAGGAAVEAQRTFDAAERALPTPADGHESGPVGGAAGGVAEATGTSGVGGAASPGRVAGAGGAAGIGPVDVHRWRGHALAVLGDPGAVTALETALAAGIRSARDRAATHAALAVALSAERAEAAAEHARTARALAERIGSTRTIALLARTSARHGA